MCLIYHGHDSSWQFEIWHMTLMKSIMMIYKLCPRLRRSVTFCHSIHLHCVRTPKPTCLESERETAPCPCHYMPAQTIIEKEDFIWFVISNWSHVSVSILTFYSLGIQRQWLIKGHKPGRLRCCNLLCRIVSFSSTRNLLCFHILSIPPYCKVKQKQL